jgi:pyruvate/2-oxoglutarate/acetoin dehydrogenase E1 component
MATAIEEAFDYLDAPPTRLAYPDVPVPYSRPLEQFCLPDAQKIADAARGLVAG